MNSLFAWQALVIRPARHRARRLLAWTLSNTMDADVCIEALEGEPGSAPPVRAPRRTMARHGKPEIFNSEPCRAIGSGDTGERRAARSPAPRFTEVPTGAGVKISMDGKRRWMDNGLIERLWRSLKEECVSLHAFETASETRAGIRKWVTDSNGERPRAILGGRTPLEAHAGDRGLELAA